MQRRASAAACLLDDDLRADLDAVVEIDRVNVAQTDATRRDSLADLLRLVRAVNAVHRVPVAGIEVEGARAERIVGSAGQAAGARRRHQMRPALQHIRRRHPVRPFRLTADTGSAGPAIGLLTGRDAIANRFAARLDEVEVLVARIDDDRAWR